MWLIWPQGELVRLYLIRRAAQFNNPAEHRIVLVRIHHHFVGQYPPARILKIVTASFASEAAFADPSMDSTQGPLATIPPQSPSAEHTLRCSHEPRVQALPAVALYLRNRCVRGSFERHYPGDFTNSHLRVECWPIGSAASGSRGPIGKKSRNVGRDMLVNLLGRSRMGYHYFILLGNVCTV